jgi:type IV pilus assembly protein PilA
MMVGMRYEGNQWRVMEVGEWRGTEVESEFLPKTNELNSIESAAAATLRTLNTALVTYATTYPEQGYAPSLQDLSGQSDQEPAPDHARLIDSAFLQEPAIKNGYEFRYARSGREHYQITATPVQPGAGLPSFFSDETSIIRSTAEARPANANDPPLE